MQKKKIMPILLPFEIVDILNSQNPSHFSSKFHVNLWQVYRQAGTNLMNDSYFVNQVNVSINTPQIYFEAWLFIDLWGLWSGLAHCSKTNDFQIQPQFNLNY